MCTAKFDWWNSYTQMSRWRSYWQVSSNRSTFPPYISKDLRKTPNHRRKITTKRQKNKRSCLNMYFGCREGVGWDVDCLNLLPEQQLFSYAQLQTLRGWTIAFSCGIRYVLFSYVLESCLLKSYETSGLILSVVFSSYINLTSFSLHLKATHSNKGLKPLGVIR